MSAIPVRRDKKIDLKKTGTTKIAVASHTSVGGRNLDRKRVVRKKSVEEELRDENVRLRSEKTSKQNSISKLENDVDRLQVHLSEEKKKAEDKENTYRAEIEDLSKKNILYEEQIESNNKKLLLSNINPISLEPIEPDEEQIKVIKKRQEAAKDSVQLMKKRIADFNDTSTQFLQDLKNIGEKLDNLGTTECTGGTKIFTD